MTDGFTQDDESDQLKARIAWFYFVGGMTQRQIADELGITRVRVNRTIGSVRAEGSVVIDLRLPLADCVRLEEELKRRYGLDEAAVVPSMTDYVGLQRTIGEAAGLMVNAHLSRRRGMGVGWGKTLSFAVRRMTGPHRKLSYVVGLMGAMTRGSGTNTFEVATVLARALDVECYYLTAPIYCPTSASRDALLRHDELAAAMAQAEEVEIGLVSCGDLSYRSPVLPLGVVQQALPELLEKGSVGEVLGCFLDKDGNIIDHPINQSIMALPLPLLRKKPISVLASGGRNKLPIIRAILRGHYVNRLVTDETVAKALLYET